MTRRLRIRFIRIATLSVAAVMLLLTVVLNVANYASINADLRETLTMIYENEGTIPLPEPPDARPAPMDGEDAAPPALRPGGPFTAETPYSTRFFVLRYQNDGTLVQADLNRIASVTEDDTAEYLAAALAHGPGYGYYGSYKYLVVSVDDKRNMAVFLDCYQELRAQRVVLLWSLAADAGCILLVLALVALLSGKAIEPVARSTRRQKQFITDASHELKTPITVIATSLRVLEMEVGKQKWIDKAQTQTEKLTELVNALVTLARTDEEETPLKPEDFPVSGAVEETAESFRDFALSKGQALELSIEPGLRYRGDEYAVRQLVSILLDNAVKYARPDTPVRVSLEKRRKGVLLCVENQSEHLEQVDVNRLFDRFYRADPARSGTVGGFGIGLSIARGIAEAHHGSIRARITGDRIAFLAELR